MWLNTFNVNCQIYFFLFRNIISIFTLYKLTYFLTYIIFLRILINNHI